MRPKYVGEMIYIYMYILKLLYAFLPCITTENKRYVNVLQKSERDKGTEAKKERTKWRDN